MTIAPIDPTDLAHNMEVIQRHALRLTQLAAAAGVVVTIERKPLQPLAMGHADYQVDVRPARGDA